MLIDEFCLDAKKPFDSKAWPTIRAADGFGSEEEWPKKRMNGYEGIL